MGTRHSFGRGQQRNREFFGFGPLLRIDTTTALQRRQQTTKRFVEHGRRLGPIHQRAHNRFRNLRCAATHCFANDQRQRIHITGFANQTPPSLFWRRVAHIFECTRTLGCGRFSQHRGQAVVADPDVVISREQHIVWGEVAMDSALFVSVIQRTCALKRHHQRLASR